MVGGEWEPGGEWGREGYGRQELESSNRVGSGRNRIDLVTVFDTILTSRQTREKLQCLYENLCRIISIERLFLKNMNMNFFKYSIHLSVRKSREKLQTKIWKI